MTPSQAWVAAVIRATGATEVRIPEDWLTNPVGELEMRHDDQTGEMVFKYRPPATGEDLP